MGLHLCVGAELPSLTCASHGKPVQLSAPVCDDMRKGGLTVHHRLNFMLATLRAWSCKVQFACDLAVAGFSVRSLVTVDL